MLLGLQISEVLPAPRPHPVLPDQPADETEHGAVLELGAAYHQLLVYPWCLCLLSVRDLYFYV